MHVSNISISMSSIGYRSLTGWKSMLDGLHSVDSVLALNTCRYGDRLYDFFSNG